MESSVHTYQIPPHGITIPYLLHSILGWNPYVTSSNSNKDLFKILIDLSLLISEQGKPKDIGWWGWGRVMDGRGGAE